MSKKTSTSKNNYKMSGGKYSDIDNYFARLKENPELIQTFYRREELVNISGPRSTEEPYYSDYIAQKLLTKLKMKNLFEYGINKSRRGDYLTDHDGVTEEYNDRSSEKIFAKSLFGNSLDNLGRILDYEMPLTERKRKDNVDKPKQYGDIDLISVNVDTNTAYIIELKMNLAEKKQETVLRAALEIETYYHILERGIQNRFKEFIQSKIDERYNNHTLSGVNLDKLKIRKAVLFACDKESGLPQELREENAGQYQNLKKLLAHLGINVYIMPYRYPVQRISLA